MTQTTYTTAETFYGSCSGFSRGFPQEAAELATEKLNKSLENWEETGAQATITSLQSHMLLHGDYATCILIAVFTLCHEEEDEEA